MLELLHFYLSNDARQKEPAGYTAYGITSEEISISDTVIMPEILHLRSTQPFCVNVDGRLSSGSYTEMRQKSQDGPNESNEYLFWKIKAETSLLTTSKEQKVQEM